MTERNERDEASPSLDSERNWDREEVFPTSPSGAGAGGPADLQGILDATKTQLSRTVQEFEAFRKRAKEERIKTILFCNEALVLDLLPILDDLDRSLAHLSALPGDVGEGLGLVLQRFHKVLERRNIVTVDPVGKGFDPLRHEAVQVADAEGVGPGVVVRTIQKGYLCSGRLLRPAKVAITPVLRQEPSVSNVPQSVPSQVEAAPERPSEPDFELVPEIASEKPAPKRREFEHEVTVEAEPLLPALVQGAEAPPGSSAKRNESRPAKGHGKYSESQGNHSDRSWVIDDDALADLEVALGEPISLPDTDAKIRSLS